MPRAPRKSAAPKPASVPVDALTHTTDTRPNIPTRELSAFADYARPKTVQYPRDPSLDPQLVWKGKDEQDARGLVVPAVPIYVQEKIHPQAIIEDLKARAAVGRPRTADLFADFNGLDDFQKKLEFYQHSQHWTNRLILGDSLLVMTSLAEKERLRGKVQCIYFDPPYGIKFGSNWQVSTRKRDVKDAKVEDLTRQPEQIKAFRDTWELGIHSYLTYLRDRLTSARDLLTESGSVFVQIGDLNVHLVRSLLDEVFGSLNNVALITVKKTSGATGELLPGTADYLLWYAKNIEHIKYRQIYREREVGGEGGEAYTSLELIDGSRRPMTAEERRDSRLLPRNAKAFRLQILTSQSMGREKGEGAASWFPVTIAGQTYRPSMQARWKTNEAGMSHLIHANRVTVAGSTINYVRYHDDFPAFPLTNLWDDTQSGSSMEKTYVVQTSTKIVERCLLMTTDPGDLVLDPTCGSGTTAYVAEQWGRRWITIDTSRVALSLARTRLMAARYPYFLLADSAAGRKKLRELGVDDRGADSMASSIPPAANAAGSLSSTKGKASKGERSEPATLVAGGTPKNPTPGGTPMNPSPYGTPKNPPADGTPKNPTSQSDPDIHRGFVYKSVPHVTLKSIANNPDIREGMSRAEIDAAIQRHADTETLFDQPYEDKGIVRVCGPFTVESLSPHRELPGGTAATNPPAANAAGSLGSLCEAPALAGGVPYLQLVLDNLRKAGVKGMTKAQRMTFDRLDPFPGTYIQAEGTTSDGLGVRVSVGPELGTVGDQWIKEAALEAIKGSRPDVLLVCAFSFEAGVHEQTGELTKEIQFGKLRVLPVRMNPDLAMFGDATGQELLKKTGAGNLFTVFGEPDLKVESKKGKVTVTIRGLDVFDPTTGEVRTGGTDDIACWFIDTDYDGQSFFVRQAYFCGADEPYEKLKKALRAEIDEGEWSKLYGSTSVPFDPPKSGRIAVKVINHYGDEILKVVAIGK